MKNKVLTNFLIFTCTILAVYIVFLIVTNIYTSGFQKNIILIMGSLFAAVDFILMFGGYYAFKKRREVIKKSFDFYVETMISSAGVGLISYDNSINIIWVSKFINSRIRQNLVGKKLFALSQSFEKNFNDGKEIFRFELEGISYDAQINFMHKVITLKDVTTEAIIMNQYSSEKLVIGELEIDSFQQFQLILSEEDLFKVQSNVIKLLDKLVDTYNIIYRQYVNGKFIIITNQDVLNTFVNNRFKFLNIIRKVNVIDGIQLTASIGFGSGSSLQKELLEMSKDGLMQAQARGGDQVAVVNANTKPQYFGSKTEIAKTISRVKVKQTAELFEEKILQKETKNIIIYGHRNADLDAVGAALGVLELVHAYGKNAYIQNQTFDGTTIKAMKQLVPSKLKELFIKPSKAIKLSKLRGTVVVIVDTTELIRIENPKALENIATNNIFIFDHHRVSKLPENISTINTYIDTSASSTSEIIVEVLQFTKIDVKLSKYTAQMLLNGIYLDTIQFQKSTSARTFQAASTLEKFGASSSKSAELLKFSEEDSRLIQAILRNIEEIKPGYFISTYPGEAPLDIISIAADEILRTSGRKAAFVIAKIKGKKEFKLSARGLDTNVQVIVESVGGGGHFGAAAAISSEPLDIFKSNVCQAITSKKGDE